MRIGHQRVLSLDGVVQAPGGPDEDTDGGFAHGGWSMPFFDPDAMGPAIDETVQTTEALLFGRRTWETMAAAWPNRAGDPFADRMNEISKYVAFRTLVQEGCDRGRRRHPGHGKQAPRNSSMRRGMGAMTDKPGASPVSDED